MDNNLTMLEWLFGNKTAVQVLLFLERRGGAYATEISQNLKIPLNMVQKQLARFERGGVLTSEYQKRRKVYSWNPKFPLIRDLKRLLARAAKQLEIETRQPVPQGKGLLAPQKPSFRSHRKLIVLLIVLLITFPMKLSAQDTQVSGTNLEFYRPSIDAYGYFGVNSPRLMKPGQYHLKISQSFAGPHIFQIAVGTTPVDLVDNVYTTNFIGSVGISNFLTMGLDIPVHLSAREADFMTLAPFTTKSVGDIRLALKFRLLEEKGKRPGLAFLFTNTFPTGNERKFLGTSHMVPGFELIAGKQLKYFDFAVNIGARFPQQKDVLGLTFNDQIVYGAAVKVPFGFWDPLFSVIGEVRGHLETTKAQIVTAPVEFTVGLQKEFKNGLAVNAGAGGAWNNAIGNPRFRALFSISYSPPMGRHDEVAWKKEEEEAEEELEEIEREKARLEKRAERRRVLEQARRERDEMLREEAERQREDWLERDRARREIDELKREEREEARREREEARLTEEQRRREDRWEREKAQRELEELKGQEREEARREREWRQRVNREETREEARLEKELQEQARERARLEAELRRAEREKARLEEELRQREKELAWKREKEFRRQKEEEERWTEKSLKEQTEEEARRKRELAARAREEERERELREKEIEARSEAEAEREQELARQRERESRQRAAEEERWQRDLEKTQARREAALKREEEEKTRERERRRRWEKEMRKEEKEDAKWKKRMIREEEQLEREEKRLARKKDGEGLRVEKELRKRAKQEANLKEKAEKEAIRALHKQARTTVYFQTGAKRPTKESRGWIDELADLMKRHPKKLKKILIEGHTDSIGGSRQNLRLSVRRAERVKEKLLRQGIEPERVEVQGQGEEQPVATNKTSQGRRLNRRAEIMVKK